MTVETDTPTTTLSQAEVDRYRRDGFIHIRSVLGADEVERFRVAAADVAEHGKALQPDDPTFTQVVNIWQNNDVLRDLTMHPGLAGLATQLAGVPLRLWHDQLLAKKPHNAAPTEFHQDAPYWPHEGAPVCLSAWVALVDVPVERGCMTFLPGQQHRSDIRAIDLHDHTDMFDAAPDLTWAPRVTVPLRAGDCTFHSGYTPHTANANDTDDWRYAFVTIYVDRNVVFNGAPHPVTDRMDLATGGPLPDNLFPPLG